MVGQIKKGIMLGVALSLLNNFSSFAGEWKKDNVGWYFELRDGSYLADCWEWIDGNNDDRAECYYFDSKGYLVTDSVVDGYKVNSSGCWVENGVVQEKFMWEYPEGWAKFNGTDVYIKNGHICRNTITPDEYYTDFNGEIVYESGIDQEFARQESIDNGAVIIIDKTSHRLEYWINGELNQRYLETCSLRAGDKEIEGDYKTPEGEYIVCGKNPNSVAYKALLLNYPKTEDAQRGLEAGIITQEEYNKIAAAELNGAQPPYLTALGGYVEIHGNRNETDMSRGCITLRNEDIDRLYNTVAIGTKVIIIPWKVEG